MSSTPPPDEDLPSDDHHCHETSAADEGDNATPAPQRTLSGRKKSALLSFWEAKEKASLKSASAANQPAFANTTSQSEVTSKPTPRRSYQPKSRTSEPESESDSPKNIVKESKSVKVVVFPPLPPSNAVFKDGPWSHKKVEEEDSNNEDEGGGDNGWSQNTVFGDDNHSKQHVSFMLGCDTMMSGDEEEGGGSNNYGDEDALDRSLKQLLATGATESSNDGVADKRPSFSNLETMSSDGCNDESVRSMDDDVLNFIDPYVENADKRPSLSGLVTMSSAGSNEDEESVGSSDYADDKADKRPSLSGLITMSSAGSNVAAAADIDALDSLVPIPDDNAEKRAQLSRLETMSSNGSKHYEGDIIATEEGNSQVLDFLTLGDGDEAAKKRKSVASKGDHSDSATMLFLDLTETKPWWKGKLRAKLFVLVALIAILAVVLGVVLSPKSNNTDSDGDSLEKDLNGSVANASDISQADELEQELIPPSSFPSFSSSPTMPQRNSSLMPSTPQNDGNTTSSMPSISPTSCVTTAGAEVLELASSGNSTYTKIATDGTNMIAASESGYIMFYSMSEDGVWEQTQSLNNNRSHEHLSVAISNGLAVVGYPHASSSNGNETGSIRVYEKSNTTNIWREAESPMFSKFNGEMGSRFGWSVGVSSGSDGDLIVASAPFENNGTGSVFLFERADAGDWIELGKFVPDLCANERYGHSVAIERNFIAISADCEVNVQIFQYDIATQTVKKQQNLYYLRTLESETISSMAIHAKNLIYSTTVGVLMVFERIENEVFSFQQEFDLGHHGLSKYPVALSSRVSAVVVGDQVELFALEAGGGRSGFHWTPFGTLDHGSNATNSLLSIALGGHNLLVGSANEIHSNNFEECVNPMPTQMPSKSHFPSIVPSNRPSQSLTNSTSLKPSHQFSPSFLPSVSPQPSLLGATAEPTLATTVTNASSTTSSGSPTSYPSNTPSLSSHPSYLPSSLPTSKMPSPLPSSMSSISPSQLPSAIPTGTSMPTSSPSLRRSEPPSASHRPSASTLPSQNPTQSSMPTNPCYKVDITIYFDDAPLESGYILTKVDSEGQSIETIDTFFPYDSSLANQRYDKTMCLEEGSYAFTLYDSGGNGGSEYVIVTQGMIVADVSEEFEYSSTVSFDIPYLFA